MKEIIKSIISSPEYWAIIIPALAGVVTFYLTKKHEIKAKWQQQKLNHYKVLLSSLSDVAAGKTNENFALAVNTIVLVAPQSVIDALYKSQMEPNADYQKSLNKLMIEIRKDIGLSKKDNPRTFNFYFIGKKTK